LEKKIKLKIYISHILSSGRPWRIEAMDAIVNGKNVLEKCIFQV